MDFKKVQSTTFIGLLIGITIIFFWLLRPYIYSIFWAVVIASLFYPVYKRILLKCKNKKALASYLTVLLIILILLIPLAGIASIIIQQAYSIYQDYGNEQTYNQVATTIQEYLQHPYIQKIFGEIDIKEKLISWSSDITTFLYQIVASSGQVTATFVIQFFIMLYTLFYFLKDGDKILKKLMYLLPLGDKYEDQLFSRFVSTSKATLKGTLLIGLIQGAIGTLALFITGIPGSAFLGLIMVILCIIPGVGAAIVLLPTGIVLLIIGSTWQAIVVFVFMIVTGMIDNFLRGPLVGKDIQMHPLFIFFATLGGLLAFGISGVVIGPVLVALLISVWEIYSDKYKTDLNKAD